MTWRQWGLTACGVIIVGLGAFLTIGPAYVDGSFNNPIRHSPYPVSKEAKRVFDDLVGVADMHGDALLWKRDLNRRNHRGHIDIPRLTSGHMALQVFGLVTKTPSNMNYDSNSADTDRITLLAAAQLWPTRTWNSLLQRALYQSEKLQRFADSSSGALVFVRTRADLRSVLVRRSNGEKVTAALLGLEGAHALEGDFDNLAVLEDAGLRMLGLAHFFDNEVAGSVHGIDKYGLTDLGRRVVQATQDSSIVIDVAHASHKAIADTLSLTSQPIIFSHGGVKGTCDTNRNLTDNEIRGIAATGGLIALGAWDAATCGTSPEALATAMAYVKSLVGARFIGIGSDFDGAIKSGFTISEYPALVQALMDHGFSGDEIRGVMGENAIKLLLRTLPQ